MYVGRRCLRMSHYQSHLESSRNLEQAFQNEVEQAKNAEVKSFFQKLASEQRTITNQLQSKVNNETTNHEDQNQTGTDETNA
jgi:hypothetical protein